MLLSRERSPISASSIFLLTKRISTYSVLRVHRGSRHLLRCSLRSFVVRTLLLATEIVQYGKISRTQRQVSRDPRLHLTHARRSRNRLQNLHIRLPSVVLAIQAAIKAQEVAHGRALELLALTEAHVFTPMTQECIHSPLPSSVCLR